MPFIVLEGLDGAGKTTQVNKLTNVLSAKGIDYEYLHFPRFDSQVYGELIARFLRGEMGSIDSVDPYLVALIFAGDRADAAPAMKGWLAEGKVVLTDRFVNSNIAFQCAKYDSTEEQDKLRRWIIELEFGYNGLPHPDLSIFLDVPFAFTESRLTKLREGDDRAYLQGGRDIHEESLDLQRKVREMYLRCVADDTSLHIVDCSDGHGNMDTPDNNYSKIAALVEPLL